MIIELNGKRYRVHTTDKHVFTPDLADVTDATGHPLKIGTKVAWGTSYRGGGGAVIGEITEIGYHLRDAPIYEVDEKDHTIYETVTGVNWSGKEYTYQAPRSIPSQYWAFRVVTKALVKNRKGNEFSDPKDVVAIANQDFGAAA